MPADPPVPAPRRSPLDRLLSALRGDKYMVDAYSPKWRTDGAAAAAHGDPPDAAGAHPDDEPGGDGDA